MTLGNVRRSRGYGFEYMLVQRLNKKGHAKRLAVSGYPDIIFTQHINCAVDISNWIYLIEAKCTGKYDEIYIQNDQIQLCFDWLKVFEAYNERKVMFAFRFQGSKSQRRKIKEYFFENDIMDENYFKKIKWIKCNYSGAITTDKGKKLKTKKFQLG